MQIVITPSTENSSDSISIQLPEFVGKLKMNMGTGGTTGPLWFPSRCIWALWPSEDDEGRKSSEKKEMPRRQFIELGDRKVQRRTFLFFRPMGNPEKEACRGGE